jgi:hypothetical protein
MATQQEKTVETTTAKANSAHGLRDLFEVGLKDIYYAEKILSKTLPKMAKMLQLRINYYSK